MRALWKDTVISGARAYAVDGVKEAHLRWRMKAAVQFGFYRPTKTRRHYTPIAHKAGIKPCPSKPIAPSLPPSAIPLLIGTVGE